MKKENPDTTSPRWESQYQRAKRAVCIVSNGRHDYYATSPPDALKSHQFWWLFLCPVFDPLPMR